MEEVKEMGMVEAATEGVAAAAALAFLPSSRLGSDESCLQSMLA